MFEPKSDPKWASGHEQHWQQATNGLPFVGMCNKSDCNNEEKVEITLQTEHSEQTEAFWHVYIHQVLNFDHVKHRHYSRLKITINTQKHHISPLMTNVWLDVPVSLPVWLFVCHTFRYCIWWDLEELVENFNLRCSVLWRLDAIPPAELSQDNWWLFRITPHVVAVTGTRNSNTDKYST